MGGGGWGGGCGETQGDPTSQAQAQTAPARPHARTPLSTTICEGAPGSRPLGQRVRTATVSVGMPPSRRARGSTRFPERPRRRGMGTHRAAPRGGTQAQGGGGVLALQPHSPPVESPGDGCGLVLLRVLLLFIFVLRPTTEPPHPRGGDYNRS